VDLGFDSANVVMGRIALGGYETEEARRAFVDTLLARLRERGLTATGIVTSRPLGGVGPATTFSRADGSRSAEAAVADARWADAGFFRALGIRVVEGELFGALDGPGRPPRAVITESMARSLWPGESAIGRRMRVTLYGGIDVTIAGVVKDVHLFDPRTAPRPAFFLSAHRFTGEIFDIAVKTDTPSAEVVTTIRHILAGLDPKIPLHRVQTLDALVASTLATDRFLTILLSAFALLGLALAGVGTYGVFAGDVAARSREIGIRLALGASPVGMLALVLTRALAVALTGVVIGIGGAAAAARSMTPLLFGVRNTDVLSFLVPAVALVLLAIAAAIVPALRASRVSPALVLGEDF
jgi:putative ABC transport system permease protein